ncbi:nickel-responsive transcriptional regulator NikR [Desulfurivibrio alkaliphilus]|uniref:Putative nickel-responsive regulator n=1 Tax=Desulfurivibrio alkaliphilus (strain DSM 19089 / UNIQEM U267 / AHT2) TaxID=589865 RepID=D6Z1K3_DESAT|nr:nickel-responsive transcriptional regulator NikR [Desulfurivibrio alkaliphilus]ADH87337.1 transcriptional regulator NikR, CopG family [Desulfurivibrio alkaliphilus AHT 2]
MLKRFSVSLEDGLLADFDEFIKRRQYTNRSEAIRDLIRREFVQEEWGEDKEVIGVISLVYDHHQFQILERINDIQHDHHQMITSTTHVHMDHDNCLEILIVRGQASAVRQLADRLIALRGVKDGHLAMSSTGKSF